MANFSVILELTRYILALAFGVYTSASLLNVKFSKKNMLILSLFFVIDGIVQGFGYYYMTVPLIKMLYPAITHLPLLLLLVIVFKRRVFPSVIAITTTYLCCQIANWASTFSVFFGRPAWSENLVYSIVLIATFIFMWLFVSRYFSGLLLKPNKALFSFSIVPVLYYIFDYVTTVYTELFYGGYLVIVEFPPFLLCIWYLIFCTVYYEQDRAEKDMENRNRLIEMKYEQSFKEIEAMKKSEKNVSLLRHDMRHFMTVVYEYLESGQGDKAKEYIADILESIEATQRIRFCANEAINMILSSYNEEIEEQNIRFSYQVEVSSQLKISDVDITSILSNSLENAVRETVMLPEEKRLIELSLREKGEKLLISVENTYLNKPVFVDDIPVSRQKGHGYGTQSIQYTVEKLNGNCYFSVTDDRFRVQIVL